MSKHLCFRGYSGPIEAVLMGVSQAIPLLLSMAANLIAFNSLLAVVDIFLSWFGGLIEYTQLSFLVNYVYSLNFLFLIKLNKLPDNVHTRMLPNRT